MSISVNRINNYMIVATLILSVAAGAVTGVSLDPKCPSFVFFAFYVSIGISCIWLMLSIMFGVKGQNSAFTNTMKLLTYQVRPENPHRYTFDYMEQAQWLEKSGLLGMFRIPGVMPHYGIPPDMTQPGTSPAGPGGQYPHGGAGGSGGGSTHQDQTFKNYDVGQEVLPLETLNNTTTHTWYLTKFARFMRLWHPFDTYAKYSMGLGIVGLGHSAAYFCLGQLVASDRYLSSWVAIVLVAAFVYMVLLATMSNFTSIIGAPTRLGTFLLLVSGPGLGALAAILDGEKVKQIVVPISYISHLLFWLLALWISDKVELADPSEILGGGTSFWEHDRRKKEKQERLKKRDKIGQKVSSMKETFWDSLDNRSLHASNNASGSGHPVREQRRAAREAKYGDRADKRRGRSRSRDAEGGIEGRQDVEGGLHRKYASGSEWSASEEPAKIGRVHFDPSAFERSGTAATDDMAAEGSPHSDAGLQSQTDEDHWPTDDAEFDDKANSTTDYIRSTVRQTLIMSALLWLVMVIWAVRQYWIDPATMMVRPSMGAPLAIAQDLNITWPGALFRPQLLACAGGHVFVSDRFRIFELGLKGGFATLVSCPGITSSLLGLTAACDTEVCWPLALTATNSSVAWASQLVNCRTGQVQPLLQDPETAEHIAIIPSKESDGPQPLIKQQVLISHLGSMVAFDWSSTRSGWQPLWFLGTYPFLTTVGQTDPRPFNAGEGQVGMSSVDGNVFLLRSVEADLAAIDVLKADTMEDLGQWRVPSGVAPLVSGCSVTTTKMLVLPGAGIGGGTQPRLVQLDLVG